MNNKTLTIIFIALLGVFALSKLFKGNTDASFDKIVINIDTSLVQKIIVHPKNSGETFSIVRSGESWTANKGAISARASISTVRSMLNTISKIEIQRLASRSKDKWTDYEVDESSGVRIEIHDSNKRIEDFIIGRFNFNQQTRTATSYLRKTNEDDTYALDGFLSMTLGQGFDAVRDKTLVNFDKSSLSAISLKENDATISIVKNGNHWSTPEGIQIDSTGITQYINGVSNLNGSTFNDEKDVATLYPMASVSFLSSDNTALGTAYIYRDENDFYINSSLHQEALFESDSSGVYKRLYSDLKSLIE